MPKMTHPAATGRNKTIDVAPSMVPMYASQGWEVQPAKKSAQPATKATDATKKE